MSELPTQPGRVKAMVLAAGLGTRLQPITDATPKCLVPIAGRPLLDYWVDGLVAAGVEEARVNTHHLADRVRAYLDGVVRSGRLRAVEAYEPTLLGSAGTIASNGDLADDAEAIFIVYADNFSDVDLPAMLAFHRGHGDPFTMLLFRASDPKACGIAELDDDGRVTSFEEKPSDPKGDLANAGVYVVSADAYREIAALGAFDIGFEVLPRFVGRMRGYPGAGYHIDVGTHQALARARADATTVLARRGMLRPAAFLDRDGTLIEQVHHLVDPGKVRLLPGAADAIRRLRAAGIVCVIVTNQSVIGRGMLTEAGLAEVHAEMNRQLADEGVALDAIYHCPVAPDGDGRTAVEHFDRKPGPGMLLRASDDLGLALGRSWMVGDMISDVLAGSNAGCRGSILVGNGLGTAAGAAPEGLQFREADDIGAAAEIIIRDIDNRGPGR